jgi:AcrR family transcriptional regulator
MTAPPAPAPAARPPRDRRAERHAATRGEILDAAWQQARDHGLAALSLRDVASAVGMRAPSLYSYFESKSAIYDAMFAQGNEAFLEYMRALPVTGDPRNDLRTGARGYVEFCVEDVARAELLFQRRVPGFEPSAAAYAPAVEALELARQRLAAAGASREADVDLWTALLAGLVSQQISNDPGGQRWTGLVDDAVDMYLAHLPGEQS